MKAIFLSLLLLPLAALADALFVTYDPAWQPGPSTLVYDDFEYVVNRTDTDKSAFLSHGGANSSSYNWTQVKSEPLDSAHGYIYTTTDPPGAGNECGNFPGNASSRVLILESNEQTDNTQTDFYLQLGDVSTTQWIPGDVWFQHWMCIIDDGGSYASTFFEGKWFYPCHNAAGSCSTHNWLLLFVRFHCLNGNSAGGGPQDFYFNLQEQNWDISKNQIDCLDDPAGNLYESNAYSIPTNTWVLVKFHIYSLENDGVTNNVFEIWKRPYGSQAWVKTADFVSGGVNTYEWLIQPGFGQGHSNMRWPTTSGDADLPPTQPAGDWWIAIDDFVMASSESGLPIYDD